MVYAAAVGLAFVSPWIAFGIFVTVALIWFIPGRRLTRRQTDERSHNRTVTTGDAGWAFRATCEQRNSTVDNWESRSSMKRRTRALLGPGSVEGSPGSRQIDAST